MRVYDIPFGKPDEGKVDLVVKHFGGRFQRPPRCCLFYCFALFRYFFFVVFFTAFFAGAFLAAFLVAMVSILPVRFVHRTCNTSVAVIECIESC